MRMHLTKPPRRLSFVARFSTAALQVMRGTLARALVLDLTNGLLDGTLAFP